MIHRKLEFRRETGGGGAGLIADDAYLPTTDTADILPDYLVRYYRWAYLWPVAVWFFDHQPIINAILFGNYRRIMDQTLRLMEPATAGKALQIAAVYGKLTPTLAEQIEELHLVDVAPVQLAAAARKLAANGETAQLARMDAERLTYPDDSFDTTLMFLLLHEMPAEARRNSLRQACRVTRPGGRLVIAEYGELGRKHWLHRLAPLRWILTTAEPFLGGFWKENLTGVVERCATDAGKRIELEEQVDIFGGFYRVMRYRVD